MVQFRKGPANRIWNVGMFTGTALVPNGMPGGVRGTGNNRPYSICKKAQAASHLFLGSPQFENLSNLFGKKNEEN